MITPRVLKFVVALAMFSNAINGHAQLSPLWTQSVETGFQSYWSDKPKLLRDTDGNLLVIGNTVATANESDWMALKYNDMGDLLWTFTWNGPFHGSDRMKDAIVDPAGNLIMVGNGKVDSLDLDLSVVKVTAGGELDWEYLFDGGAQRWDEGVSIALGADGSVYVTGQVTVDTLLPAKSIVQRISSNGQLIWSNVFGDEDDYPCSGQVVRLIEDRVHIFGHYWPYFGVAGFTQTVLDTVGTLIQHIEGPPPSGLGSPVCYEMDGAGNGYWGTFGRFRVIKVKPDATIDWAYMHPSNLPWNVSADECIDLLIDTEGHLRATGRHYGTDYQGPTYTSCDILTLKMDTAGTLIWESRYAYQEALLCDVGQRVYIDEAMNSYVAGRSQLTGLNSDFDFCVVKVDPNGNYVGDIRYAGPDGGDDVLFDIVIDATDVYVTGISMDNLDRSHIVTQRYSNTLGIVSSRFRTALDAAPNPFTDQCRVSVPTSAPAVSSLALMDTNGRVVRRIAFVGSRDLIIERGRLSPGLYTAHVFFVDGSTSALRLAIVD